MEEQAQNHRSEILIAQKERYLLRVLTNGLQSLHRRVVAICDGHEILRRVRVKPPAVLIVDVDIEPMGGEELCRRLQAELPQRDFLTCILTNGAEDEYGHYAEWFSNFRLMDKPLSIGQLRRYIDDQLAERAA